MGHRCTPMKNRKFELSNRCASVPHRWLKMDFDLLRPVLAVDQGRELLGLFAVAASDDELVLALLAVPDGVLAAGRHCYADLADVLRNQVSRHRNRVGLRPDRYALKAFHKVQHIAASSTTPSGGTSRKKNRTKSLVPLSGWLRSVCGSIGEGSSRFGFAGVGSFDGSLMILSPPVSPSVRQCEPDESATHAD